MPEHILASLARTASPPRPHVALLAGVSCMALLVAGAGETRAAPFRSINQALAAARGKGFAGGGAAAAAGSQAARQAAVGVANLQAAMARFQALQHTLAGARPALGLPAVPNGLSVGGLQPQAGYDQPGSGVWQGVDATRPVSQAVAGGQTTVTVTQNAPQAILNWRSFNVGAHTKLTFDQSAGGAAASTWTVLNRVEDPTGSPTRILGSITAPGQVLVLNLNGVLFEAGSQVNLHSLVAGAVTIPDAQFLANGIYSAANAGVLAPAFKAARGDVTVEAGAVIQTAAPSSVTSGGGAVILLGADVTNEGEISTPGGQTMLAAGQSFILRQGYSVSQSVSGAITGNTLSTVLGSEVSPSGRGTAANQGLIVSTDGDVTLAGQTVEQAGVILTTTSVDRQGTIHLLDNLTTTLPGSTVPYPNYSGSVTLEPGSVTEILPDPSGAKALNPAQQAGTVVQQAYGGGGLPDQAPLPDQPGLSRIEVTAGGTVTFAPNSLTLAPGGQIAVDSGGRIFAATGAQLDVSGLTGVTLPMASNQLAVSVEPFNLRDSPLNSGVGGALDSQTLYLDTRQLTTVPTSLADPSVRDYTAGGLLEVSGELNTIGHTASEWATVGGKIYLYGAEVVAQPGSVFNVSGGSEQVQGGMLRQSYVVGPGGTVYNVNAAPSNLAYSGVYDGEHFDEPRWHIDDAFVNPLLTPAEIAEPGYTVGRDAGGLVLSTPTAVFAGTIDAGVAASTVQVQAHPAAASDPFLLPQFTAPLAGSLTLGDFSNGAQTGLDYPTRVLIDSTGSADAAMLTPGSPLRRGLEDTARFSAQLLTGLGGLSVTVGDPLGASLVVPSITVAAPLALAPGARVALTAPDIDVEASITAPAGAITLATAGTTQTPAEASVTISGGAALSTAGLFVNARLAPADQGLAGFTNGGSVSIESGAGLVLASGTAIDVSSGAYVAPNLAFSGGHGGNVTIVADDPALFVPQFPAPVTIDAAITGYGVTGGGTVSLSAPGVVIGAPGAHHARTEVLLTPGFFTQGFASYVIDGFATPTYTSTVAGVTVMPGTQVTPVVPVLIEAQDGASAPTGAPSRGLSLYLPPEYLFDPRRDTVTQRTGASLVLTSAANATALGGVGGAITVGTGAAITVDAGQSVTLRSQGQVTVDGTIRAPGGSISLLNTSTFESVDADQSAQLSVWVGPEAVLDVSAVAETALDTLGRPFGVVPAGGSIVVGGTGNFDNTSNATAPEAFVFVRPGAELDASGTSAALEIFQDAATLPDPAVTPSGTRIEVGSNGGSITFASASGIYLDGAMRADGGTGSAAGGTLRIQLDTEQYRNTSQSDSNPAWVLTPHAIDVSQQTRPTRLPHDLKPGDPSFLLEPGVAGQAAISQAQIDDGGFGTVNLFARDQIAFDGTVDLHAAQSITLDAYTLSETAPHGAVSVAAPYVLLAGAPAAQPNDPQGGYDVSPLLNRQTNGGLPFSKATPPCLAGAGICTAATLSVHGGLIDIENDVRFGANATVTDTDPPFGGQPITETIDVAGFDAVTLASAGDIRFAAVPQPGIASGLRDLLNTLADEEASIETTGDLSLVASRIYPGTAVAATLAAGLNPYGLAERNGSHDTLFTKGVLDIERNGAADEAAPFSVFGSLTLRGATIDQGGLLYAPLGGITFGANSDITRVHLLPGSDTSVSAAGLDIPFGGTTDGITYAYAGETLQFQPASYGAVTPGNQSAPSNQGVAFETVSVVAESGSLIDVSGGGTLSGGAGEVLTASGTGLSSQGFISGRGGSTDILLTTPITFNAAAHSYAQAIASTQPGTGTGIYAILPNSGAAYAPAGYFEAQSTYAGSLPTIGEQVTIGAGVPGLPAGTYALLPATYALLPGAFRVQFSQTTSSATTQAVTSGPAASFDGLSTLVSATTGTAGTGVHGVLPITLIVTPGTAIRRYSQYDEQSYAAFAVAQAAVFNTPRPYLPEDGGVIDFGLPTPVLTGHDSLRSVPELVFDGTARLDAAPGGYDGAVGIATATGAPLVILGPDDRAPPGSDGLSAAAIDALKAPLLEIGGYFGINLQGSGYVEFASTTVGSLTVDKGAVLTAGAVWLFAATQITIDPGAEISTLGRTANLPDSRTGVTFVGGNGGSGGTLGTSVADAVVGVANGTYIAYSPPGGSGSVTIGGSGAQGVADPARLYSDSFIGVFGGGSIAIAPATRIGTPAFEVAVPDINVGTQPDGAHAAAGFDLTQATLDLLLAGDPSAGAPALRTLDLAASGSLNFFGSVALNGNGLGGQAGLQTLVLTTPAIYGYGGPGDVATLAVANLVWNGAAGAPGPVVAGGPGTGSGTLAIDAQQITFGYPAASQTQDQATLARLILGFSAVDITGTDFISANNHASLAVYQAQGATQPGTGATYTGGTLNLFTPRLTTDPGAILGITAGGAVTIAEPASAGQAATTPDGLGGEIDITGSAITDATSIVLPGGRLALDATGDITLAPGARIDLAGRTVAFFDVTQNSWGGALVAESAAGNVTQESGSVIDISASGNYAGSVDVTATSGAVDLAGTISGEAGPGFAGGNIDVRAASLGDLAALDLRLDAGGVSGSRRFEQTGPGDITIGGELAAHTISVSVDQGSLTVDGRIDASGAAPGTIDLSAAAGLVLTPSAILDAHGTVLQTDSAGTAIDAENTAQIALTVSAGALVIDPGASFDLASPDGVARGRVELNVPRGTTEGDANIEAAGPIGVSGAASLAVNAFATYSPSETLLVGGTITQADLDTIDADSQRFISAAVSGGALTGPLAAKLAGLAAYGSAFHLRPGVQIESDAASGGNLTVGGDLDLSKYRFASVNPGSQLDGAIYGSGEPGVLWLRASGTLDVFGSVTDGFAPPPRTPDDRGWVLQAGKSPSGQNLVLPVAVTLAGAGGPNGATTYPVGDYTLTYGVTIANGAALNAGAAAPVTVTLAKAVTVRSAFILNGTLVVGGHTYRPGQTVKAGTVLAAGTTIAAGTVLPFQVGIAGAGKATGIALPAGTNFSIFGDQNETLAADVSLAVGDVIPAEASIQFTVAGQTSLDTRPLEMVDGKQIQGQIWGVAPLLAAGDLSWSLRLVSGADLAAADSTAVLAHSTLAAGASASLPDPGSLVLSDAHYAEQTVGGVVSVGPVADFSVLRTGTGTLDLESGGSITEATLFGIYTAGTQSAGVTKGKPYDVPRPGGRDPLGDAGNLAGANGATYNAASRDYQAYYPQGGGDLTVSAQGDLVGDTYTPGQSIPDSAPVVLSPFSNTVSQWLWWQGTAHTPSAWWIDFGSFIDGRTAAGSPVYLTGFTGFGTLGGGNVAITAGRDIGVLPGTDNFQGGSVFAGTTGGLNVTVASTGRADPATGRIALTGGGTLSISAGGAINPALSQATTEASDQFGGTVTDLRGDIVIQAGSVGTVSQSYAPLGSLDPRPVDPYVSETFQAWGGFVVVPGDGTVAIDTRGDQVLAAAGNATTGVQFELANRTNPVLTQYLLWQPDTAVSLASLGGTIVPVGPGADDANDAPLYPPTLDVTAFSGNVEVERNPDLGGSVTLGLAPAARGQLQILAGQSILDVTNGLFVGTGDKQLPIDISGADPSSLPSPLSPSYTQGVIGPGLFTTEPDIADGLLHQGDLQPARFYAVSGDILGLLSGTQCGCQVGQIVFNGYDAAKAVQVRAGRDVVGFNGFVLNNNATDISTIEAGRDIVYANEQIAGPGLLQVQAGRNVYQGDQGVLDSVGEVGKALTQATRDDGAGITVLAGVGAAGPSLDAFATLYLDAANLADPTVPLQSQPGRVERTYAAQLLAWLQSRFGYTGTPQDALAYFEALPREQQTTFVLTVYFAELNRSGLDYNDPTSRFYRSYLEGDEAISTLFPGTDLTGRAPASGGSLTLFSGKDGDSGIHTLFGGGITTVVPTGQTSLGNYGFVPGPGAGLITEGSGDIDMYSYGSVGLGQSRVLTTFGGNILIWLSSDGEINAGRGSKSTVLNTPVGISYDSYGNVTLSPTVPSSGAGIGTLSPIAQVAAGNVNLVAPVGTVDAGEAGIRASGNANIAALTVVNGANIQVQGKITGIPTFSAPSTAAQAAAGAAAGAGTAAAQQAVRRAPVEDPSIVEVDVLGVSDTGGGGGTDTDERRRRKGAASGYDEHSAVQILGGGHLTDSQKAGLSSQEKQGL